MIINVMRALKRLDMVHFLSVEKTIQLLLLYTFLFGFHDLTCADNPPFDVCSTTINYASDSPFQSNLKNLLSSLPTNASVSKIYNTSIGNEPDRVYSQYMCLNFVTNEECRDCITTASQAILNLCPNTSEAIVWEESCQLRYSNESFFGHLDVTGNMGKDNVINISEPENFRSLVNKTLSNLTISAAFDPLANMYATGEASFTDADTLYALVQCTTDLSPADCNRCLEIAITNVSSCCYASRGARLLSRSCYLRYELYPFYDGATEPTGSKTNQVAGKGSQRKIWIIISVITVSVILLVAFLASSVYCLPMRKGTRKRKNEIIRKRIQLPDIGDPNNTDFQHQRYREREDLKAQEFYIDLATIRAATDNFSDSNMLGQGGFGPVYKGKLSDGKEIAVKRLSSCSEQGAQEFTNEVLLILKLQHKNLVRLLGFCVDGEEKLLVYELMPNSSLDVILFDTRKRAQLNWGRRLNIVHGIAKGILYLHEDSRLRIIHRDLKASNILLDCDLNPKISDFGMARIFAGSEGEANTAIIVGTYGYMAPEYAMEGLYSIKSDVFSFGVLLIEIITGKRNAGFHQSKRAPSLLAYAWQLWNEGNALELMDPLMTDICPDEFLRYIHIGLLCVQEDAFDRPTMSSVVVMLKGDTVTLSQPERPAFSVGRFTNHYDENANIFSVNNLTISNILPR